MKVLALAGSLRKQSWNRMLMELGVTELKAVGVPLYVVYGPGAAPQVLPTVLTEAMVDDALAKAGR